MNDVTTRKWTRRSAAEWRSILARHEASGETIRGFCAAEGVSRTAFCRWRQRLSEENGAATGGLFVELGEAPATWDVELELGGGVVLRVRRLRC